MRCLYLYLRLYPALVADVWAAPAWVTRQGQVPGLAAVTVTR